MTGGSSMVRIGAVMLRHLYILRSSWPRLLELAYWPFVQMVLWGFMTLFLVRTSSWFAEAVGVLISAVLLWDILFRANLGVALTFMEEIWARNLGHLYVSPLRPWEHLAAMMSLSLIRTLISVLPAALLALPFYGVWVFDLGLPLLGFFIGLMVFGWSIGLFVASLVLRFGQGAESLAWVGIFALAPLSGIYYPIDVLPGWLQPVAWALPSSHVFEGMRSVLLGDGFRPDLLAASMALNGVYLILAGAWFLITLRIARVRGLLLQQGE